MAVSITEQSIREKYLEATKYHMEIPWKSFEEFKDYYLLEIRERGTYIYYRHDNGEEEKLPPIDHHPELKEYEVWSSGYQATGESSGAFLFGKAKARNFAQACHIVCCTDFLKNAEEYNAPGYTQYVDAGRWDYDPQRLTFWACKFYWNKELASKSFG